MKKKEIIEDEEEEFETVVYEPEDILRMKKEVQFFSTDRSKRTITELKEEMDERGVGYMTNWSKPVLIKRLHEEDERDAILLTVLSEKEHHDIRQQDKLKEGQREVKLLEKELKEVKDKIINHQMALNELARERVQLRERLKEAKHVVEVLDL